jgi:Acetyltransferase (GNAT) domain
MNAPGAVSVPVMARASACAGEAGADCRVELFSPASLLGDCELAEEWDAFSAQASEPNPFGERWYLAAALQALDNKNVRIAAVRDAQGLAGLVPLIWQSHYARLPIAHVQNWLNHNAFLGLPLVRAGTETTFWRSLLGHLDRENGGAVFLHLVGMPTSGPVAAGLDAVCRADGRTKALVQYEERALLEQGLSPAAYLEAHVRAKKRKELRRQHKRLGEEGALAFQRSDGRQDLDRWIDEFLKLEQRGWKGQEGSALACAEDTKALFRNSLHGAAKAGKLELLDLRLDGKPIAMLANFLNPPGAFSFKTAFDEDYARFSPGVMLQIENLALLERDEINWCDSCAAADHPMIDSLWAGRREVGRYSIAIGGTARRAAFSALLAAEKAKARLRGRIIV